MASKRSEIPLTERRGRGDGSFRELPTGTIEFTVSAGADAYGRRQRKKFYGQNESDCRRQYKQWLKDVGQQKAVVTSYTLGAWLDRWLASYKGKRIPAGERQIAQSTIDEYTSLAERVKKYRISNVQLTDIRPIMLSEFFQTDMSGYSHTIIKKTRFLLNAAFEAALDNDYCHKNPMRNVAVPQKPQEDKSAYDDLSIRAIVRFAARDKDFGPAILLLLGTGMRTQELRALTVNRIDYDTRTIVVEAAIKETGKLGTTKNRKPRVVPIRRSLARHLRGKFHSREGYVLGGAQYINRDSFRCAYDAFFNRLNKDRLSRGLPAVKRLPPHCCRHTYSTVMQRKGVPLPVVSALLGHSATGITVKYTHLDTLDDMRKAVDGL